ncbi:MAG TPA: hypothetical protein ENJ44_03045, partial [Oceanospirillales bacterium]|nr:hypothetical protein [Oceanospirillales bacterium]
MNTINRGNQGGKRLNKYSPLFILIAAIKQSIIPLLLGGSYYKMSNNMEHFVTAIIILGALFPILTYWFYHYWIKDDVLEIKEGIFFKKNRKIPYTRIQNVNVSQGPLQRLLKVATLQLESASGGRPEAIMRVVNLDVVEVIKEKVKLASSHKPTVNIEENITTTGASQKPLLRVSTKDVIKYGIISQKGMVIGAIIFGFMAQNQKFIDELVNYFTGFFILPDFSVISFSQSLIYILIISSVIFVAFQVMSILWALMKFYQFEIEKKQDRLQACMGLLSKVSATIPLKRIQLYRLSENPLH